MSKLNKIITESKLDSTKHLKKRCQQRITSLENKYLKSKRLPCVNCECETWFIKKWRRDRSVKSSEWILGLWIQQTQCIDCKKISRPIIAILWLKPRQIITDEFLDKCIEVAIHTSYKNTSNIAKKFTWEKISWNTVRKEIARKAAAIKQGQENKESETYAVVLTDATKWKTWKTKRWEDINIVYWLKWRWTQKTDSVTWKPIRSYVTWDIIHVSVWSKKNFKTQHKTSNVICDWEIWIQSRIRKWIQSTDHNEIRIHRCNWHLSRMLWFALYCDWLRTKKQRFKYVNRLASIVMFSFKNYKQYYEELIDYCKEQDLMRWVKYLENAKQEFYNTKEHPVMLDWKPLLANSPIERVMREIDRRVDNWSRWTAKWMEAMTRVRLEYMYNRKKE